MVSGLNGFPIYFFCDEAVHGVDAHSLLKTGKDMHNVSFPIFFRGLGDYALSLSVYLQIPFVALLGLNELAVRMTTVVVSLVGVFSGYFLLRKALNVSLAWTFFLLLPSSSIWFLHSRTGFEYVVASSFYFAFLLFYILSFSARGFFIFPAAMFAAATFYSYTPARGWILTSLVILFIINFQLHWRYRQRMLTGALLFCAAISPYVFFHISDPEAATQRLRTLNFCSFSQKSTIDKSLHIADGYSKALNPANWYFSEPVKGSSGERHHIPDLAPLPPLSLPFALLGFLLTILRWKDFRYRTLIAALLAVPSAASLIQFNHVRTLPIALLYLVFSVIALDWLFKRITRYSVRTPISFLIGILLSVNLAVFRFVEVPESKFHYDNYGFYGVQMGSPEVFRWIKNNHLDYSQINVVQGSFNAPQIFSLFYLNESARGKVSMPELDYVCRESIPLEPDIVWIIPASQLRDLLSTGCPIHFEYIYQIKAPDNSPLFEIVTLRAASKVALMDWRNKSLEEELVRRKAVYRTTVNYKNSPLIVEHPLLGAGSIENLLDGSDASIIRVDKINPATFTIHLNGSPVRNVEVTPSEHTSMAKVSIRTYFAENRINWGSKLYERGSSSSRKLIFESPEKSSRVDSIEVIVFLPDWGGDGSPHLSKIEWN